MKVKNIVLLVLFSLAGLSFAYANESIVSIVNESKVENIRVVGHELCQFFIKKDKGYMHNLKDYLFGMEPEEELAFTLKKNPEILDIIFSGKASEDKIMRELQEGCFDCLSEAILSLAHGVNETLAKSNESVFSIMTVHCIDPSNNETVKGKHRDVILGSEANDSALMHCTNSQLNVNNIVTELEAEGHLNHYFKLIELLAIEETRVEALDDKCVALFAFPGAEDMEEDL